MKDFFLGFVVILCSIYSIYRYKNHFNFENSLYVVRVIAISSFEFGVGLYTIFYQKNIFPQIAIRYIIFLQLLDIFTDSEFFGDERHRLIRYILLVLLAISFALSFTS